MLGLTLSLSFDVSLVFFHSPSFSFKKASCQSFRAELQAPSYFSFQRREQYLSRGTGRDSRASPPFPGPLIDRDTNSNQFSGDYRAACVLVGSIAPNVDILSEAACTGSGTVAVWHGVQET